MNINAKKLFELFLTLMIFYGVYSLFDRAAPILVTEPKTLWVVVLSLVVSGLLLLLYATMVSSGARKQLQHRVSELEDELETKEAELQNAFKVKRVVEEEAEASILKEESNG
ncbi:hypothetical protein KC866_00020 [Patescibacteria group bacterium]|nr:hypothetical protein [Patescibacteria group bacterium]